MNRWASNTDRERIGIILEIIVSMSHIDSISPKTTSEINRLIEKISDLLTSPPHLTHHHLSPSYNSSIASQSSS
ncbi:hypothetical protein AC249_AIPGENE18109 [Exaiptasia diaphana]|nr:hypothetical protein AC249_AIPGENE18109 [Exaiptasia diaphana]